MHLLDGIVCETLKVIDDAIDFGKPEDPGASSNAIPVQNNQMSNGLSEEPSEGEENAATEEDEANPVVGALTTNLLDRLLYKGILPRYAFPTDVAAFYVFV